MVVASWEMHGTVLLVKTTENGKVNVRTRTLSLADMESIQQNPSILDNPKTAMSLLENQTLKLQSSSINKIEARENLKRNPPTS